MLGPGGVLVSSPCPHVGLGVGFVSFSVLGPWHSSVGRKRREKLTGDVGVDVSSALIPTPLVFCSPALLSSPSFPPCSRPLPIAFIPTVRSFPLQFVVPIAHASRRPRRVHVVPVVGPSLIQLLAAVLVGAGSWWCPGGQLLPSSLLLASSLRAVTVVLWWSWWWPSSSSLCHPSRSPFPPREQFLAAVAGDAVAVRGGGCRRCGSRVVVSEVKPVNNENKVS